MIIIFLHIPPQGCVGRLKAWTRTNSDILMYSAIALGIAQLLAILLAFSLCSAVGEHGKWPAADNQQPMYRNHKEQPTLEQPLLLSSLNQPLVVASNRLYRVRPLIVDEVDGYKYEGNIHNAIYNLEWPVKRKGCGSVW